MKLTTIFFGLVLLFLLGCSSQEVPTGDSPGAELIEPIIQIDKIKTDSLIKQECETTLKYENKSKFTGEFEEIYYKGNDSYSQERIYAFVVVNVSTVKCKKYLEIEEQQTYFMNEGYNCKEYGEEIICDSCTDGNCDGVCDPNGGETCVKIDKAGESVYKNGVVDWKGKSSKIYKKLRIVQ